MFDLWKEELSSLAEWVKPLGEIIATVPLGTTILNQMLLATRRLLVKRSQ